MTLDVPKLSASFPASVPATRAAAKPMLSALALSVLILSGCASSNPYPDNISAEVQRRLETVQAQLDTQNSEEPAPNAWLASFEDPQLERWVTEALGGNFSLQEARARISAAREQATIAGAPLWPTLNLSAGGQRTKTVTGATDSTHNRYADNRSLEASIAWELDLWGKLSDTSQAAEYRFQAEQASFDAARLSLAGEVSRAWFGLLANQRFNLVLDERLHNLQANLDIIDNGYRQGINSALDVYLAKSDLASEAGNRSAQQQASNASIRSLQLLLGHYPSGQLNDLLNNPSNPAAALPSLPLLEQRLPADLSARVVSQRFDVRASFLELQAGDRDLAASHKARFPSFSLTGSVGDSSEHLKDLLDQGNLAWNLLGNLTQPLFAGGKLKANEAQKRAQLQQKEQQYLSTLYTAFDEVEGALHREQTLRQQFEHLADAHRFALAAQEIAFEQYRQGLQDYSSVLEAQRRAFSAQNNLIKIQNELLQNRVDVYLALGGEYDTSTAAEGSLLQDAEGSATATK